MKQRLFIALIALIAVVTGTKAQKIDPIDTKPTLTLELYSGQTLSNEQMAATGLIAQKAGFTVKENKDKSVTFYQGKKELFTIGNSKYDLGKVVVPTDVTWAYNIKPMSLSKADLQVLADAGITVKYAYIALNISVTINKTNFTDETFRTYVSENFDTNVNNTGRLTEAEAEAVKEIAVSEKGITSLKGVEYFTKLEKLYCESNQLTALDVSKNTSLTLLRCRDNQLTTLDLSKNTALTILYCQNNQLPTLDLSKNTALNTLGCIGNPIDAEGMTNFVAHLPTADDGWFYALDQDETMYVSQVLSANNKGWTIYKLNGDKFVEYAGANVEISTSNFPDKIFREYVSSNFDTYKDGYLSRDEIAAATNIRIENDRNVRSLKGIKYFTRLGHLFCNGCDIPELDVSNLTELSSLHCYSAYVRTLDVSGCTNLSILSCSNNKLTTLDVSTNTMLEKFACDNNELTTLNVSKNTKLKELFCENNKLTSLDVSRNTELYLLSCSNNQLTSLDVSKNPALSVIWCYINNIRGEGMDAFVNSLPTVENSWFYVYKEEDTSTGNMMTPAQIKIAKDKGWNPKKSDEQAYLGDIPIDKNYFPDENFRTWLAAQSYGSDGVITDDEIATVKSITLPVMGIVSIKGIDYFTALTKLACNSNQLASLDISKNTLLTELECFGNQLTMLDLSENTLLTGLKCSGNQLTMLDLSKNTKLETLSCQGNKLSSLTVAGCTKLTNILCHDNQLTTLDVSGCSALTSINCSGNQIRGAGMTALVNKLTDNEKEKKLHVCHNETETGNEISAAQVQVAKTKGWVVRAIFEGETYYDDYSGIIIKGDANGDLEVTDDDVETLHEYILGELSADQWFDEISADANGDGKINIEDVTWLICMIVSPDVLELVYKQCPDGHHPHIIDLGLPSGTKWACCNIGADKPESYGNYYNWKVNSVKITWGDNWLMPSEEQMRELFDNTTIEWVTRGVKGLLLKGSNGGSIFLPAAGYYDFNTNTPSLVDSNGFYWTSTPYWGLIFVDDNRGYNETYWGQSIRPVRK